jgi:GTP-binding protein HflX
VLVFNKIDAVPELAARGEAVERDEYGNISRVFLSARTGQGLDTLRAAIAEIAAADSLDDAQRVAPEEDRRFAEARDDRKVPELGH